MHQEANTTPKGLRIQIRISVPDYCGSALQASIQKIEEEIIISGTNFTYFLHTSIATSYIMGTQYSNIQIRAHVLSLHSFIHNYTIKKQGQYQYPEQ